jgi:5,10-methylenetetrahydrofolate reductase
MRSNIPGVHIPDAVIRRLERAKDQKLEGRAICIEIIQQVMQISGVSGIHVMAYRQEEYVSDIITDSGALRFAASPRRSAG